MQILRSNSNRYYELYRGDKLIYSSLSFFELYDEMFKDNARHNCSYKNDYMVAVRDVASLFSPAPTKTVFNVYRDGVLIGQYDDAKLVSSAIDKSYSHFGRGHKYTVKLVKEPLRSRGL